MIKLKPNPLYPDEIGPIPDPIPPWQSVKLEGIDQLKFLLPDTPEGSFIAAMVTSLGSILLTSELTPRIKNRDMKAISVILANGIASFYNFRSMVAPGQTSAVNQIINAVFGTLQALVALGFSGYLVFPNKFRSQKSKNLVDALREVSKIK